MTNALWNASNFPAATAQATITQAAAGTGTAGGPASVNVLRCRSITASVASGATASGALQVVLRDGATGAGTIIWGSAIASAIGDSATINLSDLDLRASVGNGLTLEFTAGGAATSVESVSMSGDIVPAGTDAYAIPVCN